MAMQGGTGLRTMRQDLGRGEAKGDACAAEGGCVGVRQRRAIPAPLAARVQRKGLRAWFWSITHAQD